MNLKEAIRILRYHNIKCRIKKDSGPIPQLQHLQVLSISTVDRNWINCPRTEETLFEWLGY